MAVSKKQQACVNRYINSHYDRIGLVVMAGRKEIIRQAADREDISVNEWINRAIRDKLSEEGKKKWDTDPAE